MEIFSIIYESSEELTKNHFQLYHKFIYSIPKIKYILPPERAGIRNGSIVTNLICYLLKTFH